MFEALANFVGIQYVWVMVLVVVLLNLIMDLECVLQACTSLILT